MKFSKTLFLIFLFLYLLFPGDHEFREIGIGPEGFRVLLPDLFVILIWIGVLAQYREASRAIVQKIGSIVFLLFIGSVLFSLARGLPKYGGWAIGESRWFFSIAMMPVGFILYDKTLLEDVKKIFIFAAVVHSFIVLYNYFTGNAWDVVGDVERFGGGRQSVIMGIAIIFLTRNFITNELRGSTKVSVTIGILFFIICLLIGQTRTIFLMLPFGFLLTLFIVGILKFRMSFRGVFFSIILTLSGWMIFSTLVPKSTQSSVAASFGVVGEVFNPDTYKLILDPTIAMDKESWEIFSSSGNTLFRVLAWSQTISNINAYPGGWIFGMPMGSGFEWYGPSGELLENMQPHNDYIAIVSKVGLAGLLSYLVIVGRFFSGVVKMRQIFAPQIILKSDMFLLVPIMIMILLFVSLNAEIRTYGTHFWIWFFLGFGFKLLDKLNGNEFSMNK